MKISQTCFTVNFCDKNGRSKSTTGKVRTDRPNGGLYINEVKHCGAITTNGVSSLLIVENRVLPKIAQQPELKYNKEKQEVQNGDQQ